MHRFFIPAENIRSGTVHITGNDARHLTRVLRLGSGDRFVAVGPGGEEYLAEIYLVADGRVAGRVLREQAGGGEPPLRVTLLQAVVKGEKMDLVVQKATELGVARIVPVVTERCVVRLEGERAPARRERWQRIAQSAAAQCQRSMVPLVTAVHDLAAALALQAGPLLVAWEGGRTHSLRAALDGLTGRELALLVGPEGGLDPAEVDLALTAGAQVVSLGPRILRAETAAIALLAAVMYRLGDLGGPHPPS